MSEVMIVAVTRQSVFKRVITIMECVCILIEIFKGLGNGCNYFYSKKRKLLLRRNLCLWSTGWEQKGYGL